MGGIDFGDLIKILEDEAAIYKRFAEVEDEKTAVIMEHNIEKLDAILSVEQKLHMKVQHIEKMRLAAIKNLGPAFEKKTLVEIIELSGGGQKESLTKLLDDLNDYISEIKELNEYNTALVKSKLEIIAAVNSIYFDAATGAEANPKPGGRGKSGDEMAIYGKDAKVTRPPEDLDFGRAVVRKRL